LPRFWLPLLWAGYALPPLALFLSAGNEANLRPGVIPSVLLMAVAAVLLIPHISETEPA
jgi:hypothetical protein